MTDHLLTESWYARARDDVDLQEAIRLELGASNVLDLLWWREHPDLSTPEGAPSPFSGRDELKRLVYAKGTGEADRTAAAAALHDLDGRLTELDARVDAAIARARRPRPEAAPAPASAGVVRRPRRAWPRALRYGAIAGAAFTVGAVVGAMLMPAPPVQPIDEVDPAPALVPALGIFEIGQHAELAPDALPSTFDAATAMQIGEIGRSTIIAVRNTSNQACLAALGTDGAVAATCVSDDEFPELGLRLTWSEQIEAAGAATTTADFSATWAPDGTFTAGGSGRP